MLADIKWLDNLPRQITVREVFKAVFWLLAGIVLTVVLLYATVKYGIVVTEDGSLFPV